MLPAGGVCPNIRTLTDEDARELLSPGILRACALPNPISNGTLGPTRVGARIGCDEKTVRRARDNLSTLGVACTFNMLDVDERSLDELAAAKGFCLVRLPSDDAPDAIPASGAVIRELGEARCAESPGGATETDDELIAMEAEVDRAEAALISLKARIVKIRLQRSLR